MSYIAGGDRYQLSLVPQSLDDRVAGDSDVRILDAFVSSMPLPSLGFTRTGHGHTGAGAPEYPASSLLRAVLYGFYHRIPSSRRLEWLCRTNVEMQWLCGDIRPSHATFCTFVGENRSAVTALFRQFVAFLQAANLVDGELLALDGTKIKANAARDVVTEEAARKRAARLEAQIAEYLKLLEESGGDDDPHPDGTLHERITELGGVAQVAKIVEKMQQRQAKHQACAEAAAASPEPYYSPGDPEAPLQRTRQGKVPGYNLQLVVDSKNDFLVGQTLVTDQNDSNQLQARIEDARQQLGTVGSVVADTGYYSAAQVIATDAETRSADAEDSWPNIYVNIPRSVGKGTEGFTYDAERDIYLCPQNRELHLWQKNKAGKSSHYDVYQSLSCDGCPIRTACTTSKHGRQIKRHVQAALLERIHARMTTEGAKQRLIKRKAIVEHVGGTIKSVLGGAFRTRGPTKTATEAALASITYNIKRLVSLWTPEIAKHFKPAYA